MKTKITCLFIKETKKPRFYLTGKKQVNLFTTNTISPLVSAPGAYLVLEFLIAALIPKEIELFKWYFEILSFQNAIDNHTLWCSLLNSRIAGYFHCFIFCILVSYAVDKKAKGHISKRVFQDVKARQIFEKTKISHLLTRMCTCAYQGVKSDHFPENLARFVVLK